MDNYVRRCCRCNWSGNRRVFLLRMNSQWTSRAAHLARQVHGRIAAESQNSGALEFGIPSTYTCLLERNRMHDSKQIGLCSLGFASTYMNVHAGHDHSGILIDMLLGT